MAGEAPSAVSPRDLVGEYVDAMRERFERAAEATGGVRCHDLELAGLRLRLAFSGAEIEARLLPPFAHLAAGEGEPQLTIRAFDTAASGVEPPPPAWEPLVAAPGTNPVARLHSASAYVLAAAGTGAITAVAPERGEAVFRIPDAARIPMIERAVPLREALQLLMAARGRWLVHAGAAGRDGRGALMVGRGGSGKSTLALSCALAGMEVVADDYVVLESGPPPLAHAMQSTAKLTEDSAARLGVDPAAVDPAGFEPTLEGPPKALFDIRALAPGCLRPHLEIAAIVVPELPRRSSLAAGGVADRERGEGDEARLRRVSAAAGLRAVAPSTLIQSSFRSAEWLAALGRLARAVPSYGLELSPDPAANAAAVEGLVADLG